MRQAIHDEDSQFTSHTVEISANKASKHFIEEEIFQKLLALREEIYQATDVNVSPRKLVNALLRQADFNTLRDQLIKQYS